MEDSATAPTVNDMVVSLLNEASSSSDSNHKLECLKKVQELILYRDATLLDNFLDEVLGFQHDPSPAVKKFLLSFTELACKKDPEILTKVVANLQFFFADENINVRKKVVVSLTAIYPSALKWVAKMRNITSAIEQTWEYLVRLKNQLIPLLEDDNEGIRTYVIKFMESCILAQSCKSATSQNPSNEDEAVSLEQIPRDHHLISYRKLETEGKSFFQKILDMLSSQHVSSVNLMTCLAALSNIARQRPDFMERVVLSCETLHVNLPPTLAKSQVSSVRKSLKQHLLALLKHPASIPFQPQMTTLLTDLGATQLQVIKALPSGSDLRKRIRKIDDDVVGPSSGDPDGGLPSGAKKPRLPGTDDDDQDDGQMDAIPSGIFDNVAETDERRRKTATDATAEFLYSKLTPQNVADLVLLSMIVLPDQIPPQFQSSFTPIAAAGTEAQIRHLSRLMSTQFTALGIGPGVEQQARQMLQEQQATQRAELDKKKKEEQKPQPIETTYGSKVVPVPDDDVIAKKQPAAPLMPAGSQPGAKTSKRFHQFGLAHITRPMDPETNQTMLNMAFERILASEKRVVNGGASMTHMKILIAIVSEFNNTQLTENLRAFILADQKSRADLAILWINYEYCCFQKFIDTLSLSEDKMFEKYDRCLSTMLTNLLGRGEHKETLFHKIFLEAPLITPNSLEVLKRACLDPLHGSLCLITLREMIITRPKQRDEILCALLDFTCFEKSDLRHQSLEIAKELYKSPSTKLNVYKYVVSYLQSLLEPMPPSNLFGIHRGRLENPGKWEEDSIKACLYLFLYLLPVDYSLIHQLAEVYVSTNNETKRVILRLIETPIKAAGGHSPPELMSLIESFQPGAETLVTKVVNLLTERNPPTLDLVRRVRNLYLERVPDVRFLIPVLSGLHKREIISALPKLIRLTTNVVKEVFNRLLHGKNLETGQQSLSPAELMVALGQMEFTSPEDAKPIISALNLLISDSSVYTREVVATAIQNLSECTPLPTLLMRIVLQSLTFYPGLVGFVMNIMQRLITKQVWKQQPVWEGFVKCCSKTRPQSFQVLMQLPTPQLVEIFGNNEELKWSMKNHLSSLSTTHVYHIPHNVRKALYPEEEAEDTETTPQENTAIEEQTSDSQEASATPSMLTVIKSEKD